MTDEEVKDLAKKIYRGQVFTSYNQGVNNSNLSLIFLPLTFIDEKARQDLIDKDVDMIYARMSSASPRMINGMPWFFEFSWLNKEDTKKVLARVRDIEEALK